VPDAVRRLSAAIPCTASRRITVPSLATSLSRAVTVQGKAAEGLVNGCGWHARHQAVGSVSGKHQAAKTSWSGPDPL
jgi:hypothetical protein